MANSTLSKQALKKLIAQRRFAWAQGFPYETHGIMDQIRPLPQRRINTTDLTTYDIVLCCNAATRDHVEKLKLDRTRKYGPEGVACLVALPHSEELWSMIRGNGSGKLNEFIATIKTSIGEFISLEIGNWSINFPRIKTYRTRQELLYEPSLNTYHPGKPLRGPRVLEIEKETGCSIRIAKTAPPSDKISLSINGPEEMVMKAWLLLCDKQQTEHLLPLKAITAKYLGRMWMF